MRWIKRKYRLSARQGEERTVKMFLFLPLAIGKDVRWLEFAQVVKGVVKIKGRYKWVSIKFKDNV